MDNSTIDWYTGPKCSIAPKGEHCGHETSTAYPNQTQVIQCCYCATFGYKNHGCYVPVLAVPVPHAG